MNALEAGGHEKAPQPRTRQMEGNSRMQNPLYKPTLRTFQPLKEVPHCETVARALRPFGNSELRITVLVKNGFPIIRLSTIEGGNNRHLDLRKSDLRAALNGIHTAAAMVGGV